MLRTENTPVHNFVITLLWKCATMKLEVRSFKGRLKGTVSICFAVKFKYEQSFSCLAYSTFNEA